MLPDMVKGIIANVNKLRMLRWLASCELSLSWGGGRGVYPCKGKREATETESEKRNQSETGLKLLCH